MKMKLEIVIFMASVTAIYSAAITISGNQINLLRNPRTNLLQGVNVQESDANLLTHRISNNVKDDANTEVLGGYRPLFPPYFPLNSPFSSKKMYYDKEYYTRGYDEPDVPNNGPQGRENFVQSRLLDHLPTVPVQQSFTTISNNNVRSYQQQQQSTSSSITTNIRTYDSSPRNVALLPIINSWSSSDFKIKDDHEVTFITY